MDLSPFKAVCFDFDGTLADNFAAIAAGVNHVRALRDLKPLSLEEVKHCVGRGIVYLITHTVPAGEPAANIAAYDEYFPKVMLKGTSLLPGAADALAYLHRSGRKIALCSNKMSRFSRVLLENLHVYSYFAAVLGPEDVERPKPAPDMLLAAMKKLGVTAAETLYIGDMTVDVQTARAAGVSVWIVATGAESRQTVQAAEPEFVLDGLRDLIA